MTTPTSRCFTKRTWRCWRPGAHRIAINDQPGTCTVGIAGVNGVQQPEAGPQEVTVIFPKTTKTLTIFVHVQCEP